MKFLTVALLLPLISFSQEKVSKQIKEQRKEDRSIADAMNFPDPFVFQYIDTVSLSKTMLYSKSCQWLITVMGKNPKHLLVQDSITGKIVVTDLELFKNTTEVLTIEVKDGKYRLTLDNCKYALKGDDYLPIYAMKDSRNTRLKKYLILQSNNAINDSYSEYLRRRDDF
jgi:hypothetical protein